MNVGLLVSFWLKIRFINIQFRQGNTTLILFFDVTLLINTDVIQQDIVVETTAYDKAINRLLFIRIRVTVVATASV